MWLHVLPHQYDASAFEVPKDWIQLRHRLIRSFKKKQVFWVLGCVRREECRKSGEPVTCHTESWINNGLQEATAGKLTQEYLPFTLDHRYLRA